MDSRLSDRLSDEGFFCVVNTTEYPGMSPSPVKVGTPSTYDANNGVLVVYDEMRRPWINRTERVSRTMFDWMQNDSQMTRGCYVPHSNDGGQFMAKAQPR